MPQCPKGLHLGSMGSPIGRTEDPWIGNTNQPVLITLPPSSRAAPRRALHPLTGPPPPPGTLSFLSSSSSLAPPDTHACATEHDGAEWHRHPVRRCRLRPVAVIHLSVRCTGPNPNPAPAAAEEGEAVRRISASRRLRHLRHLHLLRFLLQPHLPHMQARLRESRPPHTASQIPRECEAISMHEVPQEIQPSVRLPTEPEPFILYPSSPSLCGSALLAASLFSTPAIHNAEPSA